MEGMTLHLEDGSILTLQDKIGEGSFSTVHRAIWSANQLPVAVKLEPRSQASHFLSREARLLESLQGQPGIPRLYGTGNSEDWSYMAIELLGNSLAHKFKKCNKRFSIRTILQIADQMLDILEVLMVAGCVHRDIKPSNFLVGLSKDLGKLYLVDFGLARKYQGEYRFGVKGGGGVIGTVPFMSVAAHVNGEYGFKDDLESALYVLIYFFRGELPWEGRKLPLSQVKRLKSHISASDLCEGLPHEFQMILTYTRSLNLDTYPNYPELKKKLREAGDRLEVCYNWVYDWSVTAEKTQSREMRRKSCGDHHSAPLHSLTHDSTLIHPFFPSRPSLPSRAYLT